MRAREETISHEGVKTEKQAACLLCFARFLLPHGSMMMCAEKKQKKLLVSRPFAGIQQDVIFFVSRNVEVFDLVTESLVYIC